MPYIVNALVCDAVCGLASDDEIDDGIPCTIVRIGDTATARMLSALTACVQWSYANIDAVVQRSVYASWLFACMYYDMLVGSRAPTHGTVLGPRLFGAHGGAPKKQVYAAASAHWHTHYAAADARQSRSLQEFMKTEILVTLFTRAGSAAEYVPEHTLAVFCNGGRGRRDVCLPDLAIARARLALYAGSTSELLFPPVAEARSTLRVCDAAAPCGLHALNRSVRALEAYDESTFLQSPALSGVHDGPGCLWPLLVSCYPDYADGEALGLAAQRELQAYLRVHMPWATVNIADPVAPPEIVLAGLARVAPRRVIVCVGRRYARVYSPNRALPYDISTLDDMWPADVPVARLVLVRADRHWTHIAPADGATPQRA